MERSAGALADAKIVAALRQGNEAGVKQLLATYQAPLLAYAFRLLADRHAAEDVVQESLMRFLDRLDDLHDPTKLRSYLYSTVTNCCRDHQRRPGRREMVATSLPQQAAAATVEEAVVDRSYVSALLQELSPTHAEVVVLRYYEDMELETIAEILGLPVGTVKSRLHYALKRLRFFSQTKAAIERAGGWAHEP